MTTSTFQAQSPKRVLRQAINFRNTFSHDSPLPINRNKSNQIEELAQFNVSDVKYHIERAKYQNKVFKKLEEIDEAKRQNIHQKINSKEAKAIDKKAKESQSKLKKHEQYHKHMKEVKERYTDEEKKKFEREKQEASRLRKEIKEFYEKEQERKRKNDAFQVAVPTEYKNALERMNKIQKKNEEFSQRAESSIGRQFARNSRLNQTFDFKARSTSFDYGTKSAIYENSQSLMNQKEHEYIQKMAQNETSSIKAFEYKQQQKEKERKRINEFFKKKIEKWQEEKSRNDSLRREIPEKCQHRIEKVENASFRKTVSSFRSTNTPNQWSSLNKEKKKAIKDYDEMKKDEILMKHTDATLRNKREAEVNEKMLSMKLRAEKVAKDFSA